MKKIMYIALASAAMIAAIPASATDFIFTFSGDSSLNGAFGTLSATDNGNGSYTATSGTISTFGPVIAGSGSLVPLTGTGTELSPQGLFNFDNLLLPTADIKLTNSGLLFNIGGKEVNIFSQMGDGTVGNYAHYSTNGTGYVFALGNFSVSPVAAVPEPATWGLMVLGFGMIGAASRSRKVKTTVSFA